MTERRRYLVLDGFVPRDPGHNWIAPGQTYEGRPASDVLPVGLRPWVRLIHPSDPDTSAMVLKTLLAEVESQERSE